MRLFEEAEPSHQWIGEASTAYLTDADSASRIHAFDSKAKIIIVLRNPADRAYSLYNWMVQEGYEYAKDFRTALRLEYKRAKKRIPNFWQPEYYWNYMYFASGLYSQQVLRYLDLFGENTLILKLEDMTREFESFYARVCKFLGIKPNNVSMQARNVSVSPIHPYLQFAVRKLNNVWGHTHRMASKRERDMPMYLLQRNARPDVLDPELRHALIDRYRPDILHLAELTSLDLSSWLVINPR